MKNTRKLTALFAILCLLATLWAPTTVAAATPETAPQAATAVTAADPLDAPLELLAKLPNGDRLCAVYSLIMDAVRNGEDFIEFGDRYTLTEEEQLILQTAVDAAIPEGYGDYIGHSYCTVVDTYFYSWFYDWGLTAEMEEAVNRRVAELTADLQGKSDIDKCLILYERLINANRYLFGDYNQTAYGALIDGMSVCAGYARSYQLLLQAVGIPCLYVMGEADNGFETGGHAWNVVKLDGHWYYCDPTWDDYDNLYFGVQYTYFNIPYAQISTNHFLDAGYEFWVPKETAPAADYYTVEGLAVETLTLDQMIALLKKHNPLPLKLLGDKESNGFAIMDLFYNNSDAIAKALGATGGNGWCSYSSDFSIFELNMVLDHEHDYQYQIDEPTCESYGQYIYVCRTCGDREWTNTDEPLGHIAEDTWGYDEWYHTRSCIHCGGTMEAGEHTYQDGVCTVCGYGTDPDSPCVHDYVMTVVIEPSCEGYGWYDYTCQLCGDAYSETIDPTGHDFTNSWSDATHHGTSCATCGKTANEEEHTYEQNGKVCDTCGYLSAECHHQYAKPCGRFCQFCGEEQLIDVAHTYDNDKDADCNVCGEERYIPTATPGDANDDGKVNNRDLGLLQRLLNEFDITVNEQACDLNGDGKVNNRDLGLLQRQLNA